MSVWDDQFDDYENDKNDFEAWLDSINESGDPEMDEDYFNEVQAKEWEKWLEENKDNLIPIEDEEEIMNQAKYPEWMVKGKQYIMTVSNN
jgi:hypothetical protein